MVSSVVMKPSRGVQVYRHPGDAVSVIARGKNGRVQISAQCRGARRTVGLLVERDGRGLGLLLTRAQARKVGEALMGMLPTRAPE